VVWLEVAQTRSLSSIRIRRLVEWSCHLSGKVTRQPPSSHLRSVAIQGSLPAGSRLEMINSRKVAGKSGRKHVSSVQIHLRIEHTKVTSDKDAGNEP